MWQAKQNAKDNHNLKRRVKRRNQRIILSRIKSLTQTKQEITKQPCPVVGCNFKYLLKFKLRQHVKIEHKGDKVPHLTKQPCPVVGCNFEYLLKFKLRQHVKIEHKGIQVDEALFHCHVDGCGLKYSSNEGLKRHIKTLHEGIKVIYKCQFCSKQFPSTTTLQRHRFTHPEMKIASDDPKYFKPMYDFTCSICDQGYLKEEDLVSHIEIHSGPNPFVCSHCNQQFTNRSTLTAHIRMEHDLEAPTCEFCGKSFTRGRNLQQHRKMHLNPNECFKCLECDYYTGLKKSLNAHVKCHHREATTVQCETCGKTLNKRSLHQHMRSHNEERRYKCHFCEKSFKHCCERNGHEEVHSALQMYVCSFCGKRSRTQNLLTLHERIHTRDPNIPPKKYSFQSKKRVRKSKKNPFNIPHIEGCIKNVASGNATLNDESSSILNPVGNNE